MSKCEVLKNIKTIVRSSDKLFPLIENACTCR